MSSNLIDVCSNKNSQAIDVDQFDLQRTTSFATANFLSQPKLPHPKSNKTEALKRLAAEALYYFFSNQYEKISDQHIDDINALFITAKRNIGAFMAPATVLSSIDAINSESWPIEKKKLARLIDTCRDENFAIKLVETAVTDNLSLPSPFSDYRAYCQESYEVEQGLTCLRFTDAKQCFFLMQSISSADSIYFPQENILLSLSHAGTADVNHLQFKLLSRFRQVVDYAKAKNTFSGLIASNSGPDHFYYEIWPVLATLHKKNHPVFAKIPCLIMRKDHDFSDLKLLFPQRDCLILDTEGTDHETLNNRKWFVQIGNHPHLRRNYRDYEAANRYLFNKAKQASSESVLAKISSIDDCYPLVWIGVEEQQCCWLEQIEGYAYILNKLGELYPRLGVIIDGCTLPFTPSEKSLGKVQEGRSIAEKIIARLNPTIKHISTIGENSNSKIVIGEKIDFFICNFTTGSLYVSHILGKPGFCHSSNRLAKQNLQNVTQIHPNRNVYLLPKSYVTDKKPPVSYLQATRQFLSTTVIASKNPKIPVDDPTHLCYSIDKKDFYQFIEERLDNVINNTKLIKLRFFLEPSFSIHPDVRHYLKIASHGNILDVFPTLSFPKNLTDLVGFSPKYLRQHIIYGLFAFSEKNTILNQPSEYLIWLGDPLQRVQLHVLQFIKNAAKENKTIGIDTVLKSGHKALDNYYTRLVSGLDVPYGKCTENMLNIAIYNLTKHFIFIGINEQQAQSFDRLCTLLDWDRSLFPENEPENKFHIETNKFSAQDNQMAKPLVKYDLRLYKAALAILSKKNN